MIIIVRLNKEKCCHIYIYVCVAVCVCVYVYVCVRMCVCASTTYSMQSCKNQIIDILMKYMEDNTLVVITYSHTRNTL